MCEIKKKSFNKNNEKISYICVQNIENSISHHNDIILSITDKKTNSTYQASIESDENV